MKSRILINQSLSEIRRCNPNHDNFANRSNAVAIDLLQIWGICDPCTFEKSNLFKIQRLLYRSSLPGRIRARRGL